MDICKRQASLKELSLSSNNLAELDPCFLAGAVKKLEYLGIKDTQLTREQVEAIFMAMCEEDCQMEILDIRSNNLSTVNPDILARTVVIQEYLKLDYTKFTKQQKDAIFAAIIKEDSWVKKLNLSSKDLSTLDPSLIARDVSVKMLRKVTDRWWEKRQTQLEFFCIFLQLILLLLANLSSSGSIFVCWLVCWSLGWLVGSH